jgi:hypothetical protein
VCAIFENLALERINEMNKEGQQLFTVNPSQLIVGYWSLSDDPMSPSFAMFKKPSDEQIKNAEELLGWKWIDNERWIGNEEFNAK